MKKLQSYNQKVRSSRKMPEFRSGDIVRVHRKVKEGEKERTQVFEGIIISVKGKQSSSPMITVRKVSFGVGVEITIPVFSPLVEKIEVLKKARTRRAKLYYLRRKDFKISKLKMKELEQFIAEEPAQVTPSAEIETGGKEKVEAASAEEVVKPDESEEEAVKEGSVGKKETKKN